MRAFALLPLALCSCIGLSLGQGGSSDAGSSSSSTTGTSDASAEGGGATGINCGQDTTTGVTLCLGISTCPGLTIDPDAMPGCGFRVSGGGATLDLECVCNDYVCPVGVATSCAQAKTLLSSQTEPQVCTQVNDGRCVQGTPTTPPPSSSCDKTCESECGGDPSCIKACGC